MLGTIVKINSKTASFALKTDEGYSIFQCASSAKLEIGDLIEFDGNRPTGISAVTNKTKNQNLNIDFKEHNIPAEAAQEWLFPLK